jgi:hypothetical protein
MPRSVRYARGLLWLQCGIWACGALLYAAWAVTAAIMALTGHADLLRHGAVVFFPVAVVTGGFAAAKFRLARSLAGRRERTRKVAVGVEIAMACLGSLITAGAVDSSGGFPAGLFAYAGFVGGCLSLAAALGLMRHPARRFFTDPGPALGSTPDGDSRTACSAPVNTLRRNLTLRPA